MKCRWDECSGHDSVCRVVASNTRGPQFKSSHRQNFMINIFTANCWKDKTKEKSGREWPIFDCGQWPKDLVITWVVVALVLDTFVIYFWFKSGRRRRTSPGPCLNWVKIKRKVNVVFLPICVPCLSTVPVPYEGKGSVYYWANKVNVFNYY